MYLMLWSLLIGAILPILIGAKDGGLMNKLINLLRNWNHMEHREATEEAGKYQMIMSLIDDADLNPVTKLLIINTLSGQLGKDWRNGIKQRKHFDKSMNDFLKKHS